MQLSADPDFHYEILRVMSLAPYQGADLGEVLVAAQKIQPKDVESFYGAFNGLATRVDKTARAMDARKKPISARQHFFKAATYYRSADFFLHGNGSDPRIDSLWEKHLAAFNSAIALLPTPGRRISLGASNDSFTIPAIFYGCGMPGPRPTLILGNGYDGAQEEMYHVIGQAALERGINVMTYEGPGQPSVRREQNLGFIPDWEKVVTPVIDHLLTRPEVDPRAIGLLGYSMGGYLAPRAAAFDHRLAAVLAVDGVYDYGAANLDKFPERMRAIFKAGDATLFNRLVEQRLADPAATTAAVWGVQQGLWSFNVETPFEWMTKLEDYTLASVLPKIRTPVFVAQAERDDVIPGQSRLLAEKLGELATHHVFESVDGAAYHCSVGASVLQNHVLLDWFEDVLQRRSR
ncbi:2,6-dihydropseudooxynicotine hydrolase [Metarhizium album ARSEF 1941]|uniref:2,6-dihydropseudooxynicotine hydrolase n=1 Tax=Metarhizium album (strain ARSEF 1941) TaxID=1081103 RepID=A0A0B2WVD0_METAS|nr:2,6-dihydropseudooxynicotine hydrolase [Metarhizium album ARSEF 1941]KHN97589.1 2,6-dihydropseudooxynicotine hydrolase [Metarhizium album ARSEF 1941]